MISSPSLMTDTPHMNLKKTEYLEKIANKN